jgi:hypothetical protein
MLRRTIAVGKGLLQTCRLQMRVLKWGPVPWRQRLLRRLIVDLFLHSDHSAPMKGETMLAIV